MRCHTKWGKTRTKIPDGAETQVGPFPVQWKCGFRTLTTTGIFLIVFLVMVNKVGRK